MRWLLEHLQILIVIAGAIAYYINQRRREKEGLPPQDEEGTFDPASMEAEEAERTRRLQEELRRKREQRTGGMQVPGAPVSAPMVPPPVVRGPSAPPPVFQDPLAEMMKDIARHFSPVPAAPVPAAEEAVLQRQREYELRLKELDAQRLAMVRQAELAANAPMLPVQMAPVVPNVWQKSLHDPSQLRRAIVLNEILGKPVGLR